MEEYQTAYNQEESQPMLESFVTYLIDTHLVDNSQPDGSETLSKFLQLWDQFEQESMCDGVQSQNDEDSQMMFETKAIFTLADFLKSLSANEYYDISQKLYNSWQEKEHKKNFVHLEKLVKIKEKHSFNQKLQALQKWKQFYEFSELIEENERMREYIQMLMQNNDSLEQERNILEMQSKKRNQNGNVGGNKLHNNIQPLRQSRRNPGQGNGSQQRSASRSNPIVKFMQPNDPYVPIHERLHREAYKKTQQQVINDVIKERDQLKDCTFKPNMSQGVSSATHNQWSNSINTPVNQSARNRGYSINSNTREDPFLYERLSKSTKKFNPELMQLQKEQEEMKDCTFQPQTNGKSKQLVEQVIQQDYNDREQFYDRLYREGETKDKYKKSLQMLKDHAETNGCTFQPETNTHRTASILNSSRKHSESLNQEDPFTRLHQEHEYKQRSMVKKESEYDEKFKERHPFQPTRVAKNQDTKLVGKRNENSQQRASRLYDEYKDREKKIQDKREELQKEEEKLCKLTLATQNSRAGFRRQSIDGSISQISNQQPGDTHTSQMSTSTIAHERLYTQGKDKEKKQNDLRNKVYREQGFSFQPAVNNEANSKYLKQEQTVIDRTKDFLERKENHIKEIQDQTRHAFQPQRVTKGSKLAKEWERENYDNQSLGDKLHSKGAEMESKREKLKQELSIDKNCTFKPQLAKKTDKILRELSQSRQTTNMHSRSSTSVNANNTERQPFTNRTNN